MAVLPAKKIATAGVLSAVAVVLGITRLGIIPWFSGVGKPSGEKIIQTCFDTWRSGWSLTAGPRTKSSSSLAKAPMRCHGENSASASAERAAALCRKRRRCIGISSSPAPVPGIESAA